MVLSSQVRYDRLAGGVGRQPSKHSASGVPFRSRNVRAFLSSSPPDGEVPQDQTRNTTKHDESSSVRKQQYVTSRLPSLPPHVLESFFQACIDNEPQQPTTSQGVVDPRAAKLLQTEEPAERHTITQRNASKRKAVASADSSDEENDDDWRNHGNVQITLHIANEDEVVHFLKMRFTQIQQLATKVIAKAWIKAICPKKQANFPYVDSNPRADQNQKRRRPRHDGPPRIPHFWPDVSLCRHKEPDHTRKTERTHLLVHLLRLHWTEQDWLESNGQGSEVPQKIKDRNWVGFLKDAFPISKLEEVQGSKPDKAFLRQKYLGHIYKVAEDEQMMRRRVGPPNQKRTYTAGAGWFPAGSQAAGSTSQSDRPDSEDEPDSPAIDSSTKARSLSQSDNYAVSPDPDEQEDDSGSASSYPGIDVREAKVEQVSFGGFIPLDEAVVPNPGHGPELKFDPADEPMTIPLGSIPPSRVEDMDYYDPSWGGSTAVVQRTPDVYRQHQYAGATTPWYGIASLGQPQQGQISNCQPSAAATDQSWSDYRHGYVPFQSAASPNKATPQTAVSHNPGFGGMHQMTVSAPFIQPVATAANDSQHTVYQGSGAPYVPGPFEQHNQSGYMGPQHQGMYSGWL